jgi:hypothetical protein
MRGNDTETTMWPQTGRNDLTVAYNSFKVVVGFDSPSGLLFQTLRARKTMVLTCLVDDHFFLTWGCCPRGSSWTKCPFVGTLHRRSFSVTAQINAAEFDFEFVAERMYVPNFDLEDMKELRVTVVPRDVELFPHDRAHNKYHCRVDVAVQKKFSKGTNEEIDPLVDLVERIADEFRLKRLDSFQAARCVTPSENFRYLHIS